MLVLSSGGRRGWPLPTPWQREKQRWEHHHLCCNKRSMAAFTSPSVAVSAETTRCHCQFMTGISPPFQNSTVWDWYISTISEQYSMGQVYPHHFRTVQYGSGISLPFQCSKGTRLGLHIEGFRPEWCISTTYHAWDTPFWSETLDLYHPAITKVHNGGSQPWWGTRL